MPPLTVRPVEWVGSSLKDLRACPEPVRDVVGYALFLAQCGQMHPAAKRLKGELIKTRYRRALEHHARHHGGM